MQILTNTIGFAGALTLLSCAPAQKEAPGAIAQVFDAKGQKVGTATIEANEGAAVLKLELKGLPQGTKAIHLHEIGACIGPDFKSAGGHLNPEGKAHGKLNPQGKHLGDLPNIEPDAAGRVQETFELNRPIETLVESIFDLDGAAVVIHAGSDDFRSDPAGNAGARIACGVFERSS